MKWVGLFCSGSGEGISKHLVISEWILNRAHSCVVDCHESTSVSLRHHQLDILEYWAWFYPVLLELCKNTKAGKDVNESSMPLAHAPYISYFVILRWSYFYLKWDYGLHMRLSRPLCWRASKTSQDAEWWRSAQSNYRDDNQSCHILTVLFNLIG